MLTLVFLLRRRPELAADEFHRYWRERHAPLVAGCAATLGITRYTQLHSLDAPLGEALRASRGCEPNEYDGVALVTFDSVDTLVAAASTPEGREAGARLLEDERRFLDLERCVIWLADDVPIVEG